MKSPPFHVVLLSLALANPLFSQSTVDEKNVDRYLAQYAPYEMKFDAGQYSTNDKLILKKLIQASEYLDTIYWMQTSEFGMKLRDSLIMVKENPQAQKLLTLLVRNTGPFELLNDNAAFMGSQQFYPGQEFYPRGMTVEQFDAYYKNLPDKQQKQFISSYTVIRQDDKGGYKAVPFHQEYKRYLAPISELFRECATLTTNVSF